MPGYESVKRWRERHPEAYKKQSTETMRERRAKLTDDYVIGLLRQMGFKEFPPAVIARERLRLMAIRTVGTYQKKKKPKK